MPRRMTQEEFIAKANIVHNNKYDYSKTKYVNQYTKVIITCPEHGDFCTTPGIHLAGHRCPKCGLAGTARAHLLTTATFIRKAKDVHGEKYDYSKVRYVHNKIPVLITCPIHGDFSQNPRTHLQGKGCPKCGRMRHKEKMTHSKEWFVKEARKVHGNKYSYERTNYTRREDKVIITCPIHGDFKQKVDTHLAGHGCPKCFNDAKSKRMKDGKASEMAKMQVKSREQFIKDAIAKHGDFYNYDKVVYKHSCIKVTITCPIHGDFRMQPNAHLNGHCCPRCRETIGERAISLFLERNKYIFTYQHRIYYKDQNGTKRYFIVDFYLPNTNTIIEFNGRQHYIPIGFFGGEKSFRRQVKRDDLLREYCKNNRINLIEIPYTEYSKINEILTLQLLDNQ